MLNAFLTALQKIKSFLVEFSIKDFIYLFIIVCLLTLMPHGCGRKDSNTEIKKPAIVPTVQKVDKKGTSYTEIEGTIYTQEQMKQVTDSFRRVLGKGKVQQVTITIADPIHDTIPVPVYIDTFNHILRATDSSKFRKITFKGNWITKDGEFTLFIVPDTATYVTTLKERLFRPNLLTTNVYHTNDMFKPVQGTVYTSKASRPLLDFDVMMIYDVVHKQVGIGPGVGIHIFSIKRKN